nr:glutamate receptor ionotropic, NMDA 1-like [Ciona intestinalis]|eukprot:XP_018672364.1 glutamate receptor ionotropic, NMDA 1-like [Ciona intestinalis]
MVIVATYTANLAAFLVLDRSEHLVTDIHDPKLRDPLVGARYATVRDSAVESYLNEKVEFDSISKQVTRNSYENSSSAIEDLKLGKLEAFIWDSASLQYERSVNCDLVMAGEPTFGPGFGIAMRKKDKLLDQISLLLLSFHENGFMDSLRLKWTLNQGCPQRTSSPATLKLENMVGVFILIGIGIISGAIFTAIEVVYKRKRN